jgi:hypothetical protein
VFLPAPTQALSDKGPQASFSHEQDGKVLTAPPLGVAKIGSSLMV